MDAPAPSDLKSRPQHGWCSLQSLLLTALAAGAGYAAWYWWSPASTGTGNSSTGGPSQVAPQHQQNSAALSPADHPEEQNDEITTVGIPPTGTQVPTPRTKAIVRRMFEEWKRRYLSTERKAHGAMLYDMSELLTDLKKDGLYTDQAVFREIDRSLQALGVPPDQSQEVAISIFEQATAEGKKQKKQDAPSLR